MRMKFAILGAIMLPLATLSAQAGTLVNLGPGVALPTGNAQLTDVSSQRTAAATYGFFTQPPTFTALDYSGASQDASGAYSKTSYNAGFKFEVSANWANPIAVTGNLNVYGADKHSPRMLQTYSSGNLKYADISEATGGSSTQKWRFVFSSADPNVDYLVILNRTSAGAITADVNMIVPPSVPLPAAAGMAASGFSMLLLKRRRKDASSIGSSSN